MKLVLWCNSAGRFEGLLSCVWIQNVQIKNAALSFSVAASGLQAGRTDCQSKLQVLQADELSIKTGVKWSCQLFSGGFEDVQVVMDAASNNTLYVAHWEALHHQLQHLPQNQEVSDGRPVAMFGFCERWRASVCTLYTHTHTHKPFQTFSCLVFWKPA